MGLPTEGFAAGDMFELLKVAGHHALPVPLAEMVLFGTLSDNGGTAHVRYDEASDSLVVEAEVEEKEPAEA